MWSSVFRAALGHRDELEKSLAQPPGPAETVAGNILMQHLEGGPWQFLIIAPYNSRQEFAAGEKASVADTLKPDGGWLAVRNHSTYHNHTITDRIAP
jgi:heme-degrading monooxygenase HmoA